MSIPTASSAAGHEKLYLRRYIITIIIITILFLFFVILFGGFIMSGFRAGTGCWWSLFSTCVCVCDVCLRLCVNTDVCCRYVTWEMYVLVVGRSPPTVDWADDAAAEVTATAATTVDTTICKWTWNVNTNNI